MLDKLAPAAEKTARETAEDWLNAFAAAVRHGDGPALTGLFVSDSHWRTGQPALWFTAGAISQARIHSRTIALQIDAIERGKLAKAQDKARD
jgi:hypothetical protein